MSFNHTVSPPPFSIRNARVFSRCGFVDVEPIAYSDITEPGDDERKCMFVGCLEISTVENVGRLE